MKRYRKPYRVKRKKTILKNRFIWIAVLVLFLVGSVIYLLFFSPVFQIKKVTISGANQVSQKDIRSFVPLKNIILLNKAEIKKNILNNFPEISGVEIDRKLPATVNIEIKERAAAAVWCNEEKCFLVDKNGKAFREASEEDGFVKVLGAEELLQEKIISQMLDIDSKLKKDLSIEIENITFDSSQRLNVKTVEGWEIYFNPEKDISWQLTQLHLVLEIQISPEERKSLEYVELRFDKVYYK